MASPISCLSILVIPLLVTSLFYQVSNAVDKAFLESICHKSFDHELCLSTLCSDERTSTADPNGLVLISISINMNLVQTTINHRIPDILKTLTDPPDKTRLKNCQTDFIYVLGKLSRGYVASASKHYQEGITLIYDALLKSAECDSEYRISTNPPKKSPISDVTFKVGRLIDITFVIVDEIVST
ncbi:cell wall / vacuolar inhibitor of fructosidase 2-like [Castanea sativa]|uniref:cell wall / vacuolar inhibitor of fructosidase 2-like n=1 Tax=Castanea sativa TaxID=21020 RepID=UPI003F64BF6F